MIKTERLIISKFTKERYEALNTTLEYVHNRYGIKHFFYEADIRNIASMKLLEKFSYEQGKSDCFDTETGKHLELQGFTIQLEDENGSSL